MEKKTWIEKMVKEKEWRKGREVGGVKEGQRRGYEKINGGENKRRG